MDYKEKIIELIESHIHRCGTNLYPEICNLIKNKNGEDKVIRGVYDIVSKTGMSVDSAISQYESTI